ncbi:MAG: serine/threonine protein kinase [Deltaproteobacteria bacterium]|nr:serine/threonine protein kinase [Deltaproteobacteria bacterium]
MLTVQETSFDTPQGLAFLQQRVSLVGKLLTVVFGIAQALQGLLDLLAGCVARLWAPESLLGWTAVALSLAMWLGCRTGTRSRRWIHTFEAACLLATVVVVALMGRYINLVALAGVTSHRPRLELVGELAPELGTMAQLYISTALALALSFQFALRAALVPSTSRRTMALTAAALVPLIAVTALGLVPFEADLAIRRATPSHAKLALVVNLSVWWTMVTVVCTAIGRIIFKLHREVRQAKQMGQYTLEEKLGEGGMGLVYRARHALMRRPTAIKLLPPEKMGEGSLERFEREVQLTAKLTHPNTITIFDYGHTPEGTLYYAMELLEGASLEGVVDHDGAQPPARVVRLLSMVAGALAEAHDVGLIHRDIKPANIFLTEQGGEPDVAKVLDFGLVKTVREPPDAGLTRDGVVTGTPLYMPPEALTSPEDVDQRSDLYALGAVGYFLLTATHVFDGNTLVEICGHHLHSIPTPPSERLGTPVPECLEEVILACLAKDPAARPQTARELRQRLAGCEDVGSWGRAEAHDWWEEHGRALRHVSSAGSVDAMAPTVAVDLARDRGES